METAAASTHAMTPTQGRCVAATRSTPCTQTARPASVSDNQDGFPVHTHTRTHTLELSQLFDCNICCMIGGPGHFQCFSTDDLKEQNEEVKGGGGGEGVCVGELADSSPNFLSPSRGLVLFKHPAGHKRDRELLTLTHRAKQHMPPDLEISLHAVEDTKDETQVSLWPRC